tara:strand:- start:111 stop:503 length:393 start_codon:yes stop_codon:yes gene_type:complete
VLGVERVLGGEQAAILGVEQKDHAQEHREKSLVEVIVLTREGVVEQIAPVPFGRCLEPGEQDLKRLKHLLRKLVGNVGLPLPTLREQRGQRLLPARRHHRLCPTRPGRFFPVGTGQNLVTRFDELHQLIS